VKEVISARHVPDADVRYLSQAPDSMTASELAIKIRCFLRQNRFYESLGSARDIYRIQKTGPANWPPILGLYCGQFTRVGKIADAEAGTPMWPLVLCQEQESVLAQIREQFLPEGQKRHFSKSSCEVVEDGNRIAGVAHLERNDHGQSAASSQQASTVNEEGNPGT
jgi:hypothetical protein